MICPNCGEESRFTERFGPDADIWLACDHCGKQTDEKELAAANEEDVCQQQQN